MCVDRSLRTQSYVDRCMRQIVSENIQIKRVVGAALALRWEKEKQVQEKNSI